MNITLRFLGAARGVTGSRYLVESNGDMVLVDCGLYQEREFQDRNWKPFQVPPKKISAVLLTHAHLDHCGLLPRLVSEGFRRPIYCTPATADIAKIILLDSAHIQEEDAAYKKKRHIREGRKGPYPEIPLYTVKDAEAVSPLFRPVDYKETVEVAPGIEATFYDAGHVLGSSMIKVRVSRGGEKRSIVFSGDIGRWDRPILEDPTVFKHTDYVVVESTYGDRKHEGSHEIDEELTAIIRSAFDAGGNIIVPSFALQRAQEILYHVYHLNDEGRIPSLPIYLDSPMAIRVNAVYRKYSWMFDKEMRRLLSQRDTPLDFPGLTLVETAEESKSLNQLKGTFMIIAGSGMATGGRVKHHLANNISRPESTILFIGYQAYGTLGRQILDGAPQVRIFGQMRPVRARVAQIQGFSAHADRDDLLRWISALSVRPRQVFVTHGEAVASEEFKNFLIEKTGFDVMVPSYNQTVRLD